MDRKRFFSLSAQAAAGAVFAPSALRAFMLPPTPEALIFSQAPLPYPYEAHEPHIDALTMQLHYGKHHAAYVKNANEAIAAEANPSTTIEQIFGTISSASAKLRNNAGGAWNHDLFWSCMGPGKGGAPEGKVNDALVAAFGGFEKFKEVFTDAAMKRFGSGWAWLISKDGKLEVVSTANQDNPLMDVSEVHGKPLLALDVWEHAYYLKYQDKRADYVALVEPSELGRRSGKNGIGLIPPPTRYRSPPSSTSCWIRSSMSSRLTSRRRSIPKRSQQKLARALPTMIARFRLSKL